MKSSGVVIVGFLLFAIGSAIVIGSRLSDQAVAALAGAACGVGLAGPVGLALGVYVGSTRARAPSAHVQAPPQVIVISPAPPASNAPGFNPAPGGLMPMPRSFTIIGEGSTEEGDRPWE